VKESDIKYQNGDYWVGKNGRRAYTVYHVEGPVSIPDSSYKFTPDGLSIAIARCKYLAKRK